jgi:hypothetical protein
MGLEKQRLEIETEKAFRTYRPEILVKRETEK